MLLSVSSADRGCPRSRSLFIQPTRCGDERLCLYVLPRPSLVAFQRRLDIDHNKNNLQTLFKCELRATSSLAYTINKLRNQQGAKCALLMTKLLIYKAALQHLIHIKLGFNPEFFQSKATYKLKQKSPALATNSWALRNLGI